MQIPSRGCRALLLLLFFFAVPAALAQQGEESVAARETYIPQIKLYPAHPALEKRGIRLAYVGEDVRPGDGRYFCGELDEEQVGQAAQAALDAIRRLPVKAWRSTGLKYILLCSEARAGDRAIGGIPVPPIRLLMLGTGRNPGGGRFAFTLLHELYHMVEISHGSYEDKEWDAAFGGYTHSYGSAAAATGLGSGGPGFINAYGRSFPQEERAELFAIRLLSGEALQNHIAQTHDALLQQKLDALAGKCPALFGVPC
jgi:hypothetical protein